jgi:hypothetical protein
MLNAHPEIISVGELKHLRRAGVGMPCGCGADSLEQCAFWSSVDRVLRKRTGKSLGQLDCFRKYSIQREGLAENVSLFHAISEASGKSFVVDSSKRPGRLKYLLGLQELDVYPVHLIRDARGQVLSMLRRQGGFAKHILRYRVINSLIHRAIKSVPHASIDYEELVRDPEPTLRRLLEPLGLSFSPKQMLWSDQERHLIAGNKMRWEPERLVLDERWKESLSRFQQAAILAFTSWR